MLFFRSWTSAQKMVMIVLLITAQPQTCKMQNVTEKVHGRWWEHWMTSVSILRGGSWVLDIYILNQGLLRHWNANLTAIIKVNSKTTSYYLEINCTLPHFQLLYREIMSTKCELLNALLMLFLFILVLHWIGTISEWSESIWKALYLPSPFRNAHSLYMKRYNWCNFEAAFENCFVAIL